MKPKKRCPTPSKSNLLPRKPISSLPTACLQLPAHTNFCFLLTPNKTTDRICQEPSRLNATQRYWTWAPASQAWWGGASGQSGGEYQREDGHQEKGAPMRVQGMWLPFQGYSSWYCRALQRSHGPKLGKSWTPPSRTLHFIPQNIQSPWAILNRHVDSQDFSFSPLGRQWGKGGHWKSRSCPLGNLNGSRVAMSP